MMPMDGDTTLTCKISTNLLDSKEDTIKYEVGDIFHEEYFPAAPMLSKSWHIHIPPSDFKARSFHKIVIRHGQISGKWVLIQNGIVIGKGYENPVKSRKFQIKLIIDEKPSSLVCDGTNGIKYKHSLYINGEVKSDLEYSSHRNFGELLPLSVSIPDIRTYSPDMDDPKQITVYQLYIQLTGVRTLMKERRFSEFVMLDTAIRSQTDSSFITSLPALPSKIQSPFSGQSKEAFIQSRKESLEIYIQAILSNKKIHCYTEVLCFLGLDPLTGDPFGG